MRLIDAECDELMETIDRRAFNTRQDIQDWIDSAPTVVDAVQVVYCRNCKYRRKNDYNEPYCINKDGLSDPWDDCFCSYGERKE